MAPEFMLDIDQETFESSGSKFINVGFDLNNKAEAQKHNGQVFYRKIELGMLDWDTPGKSMKIPTTILDQNFGDGGHEEKLSFGVDDKSIWKGKALWKNITGKEPEMKKGKDGKNHPVFDSDLVNGKKAVGVWTLMKGTKGGQKDAEVIFYPKLTDIYPEGYTPTKEEAKDLGI